MAMRRFALALVVALFLPARASEKFARTAPSIAGAGSQEPAVSRLILRRATGRVERVELERYVASVLPAEIGGYAPVAALEAQAVAARSYAVARAGRHAAEGADLCDGTHCQVYRGERGATAASRRAVEETRGLVLVQKGRVIAAPFHAACGGHTARPADVWDDEEIPELEPVTDDACPSAHWSYRIPRDSVSSLGAELGLPGARFFEVFGRGGDGRAETLRFVAPGGRSLSVRATSFREAATHMWGPASVRSTLFSVVESRHEYLLLGRGSGHGAGLCQEGAIARARRGESFRQILATYYRGAQLASLLEEGTR